MKLIRILAIALLTILISVTAFAHSGGTDGAGGHYNRSTGEYHYHHGKPAHQHINGVCPYNYNNKTNHSKSTVKNNYNNSSTKKNKSSVFSCVVGGLCSGFIFGNIARAIIFLLLMIINKDILDKFVESRARFIPVVLAMIICTIAFLVNYGYI